MSARRNHAAHLGFFLVALVALVCVDCFNAPASPGWNDLRGAPHLAATVQHATGARSPSSATRTHFPALPLTPVALSVCLLFLGFVAAGTTGIPRHLWRARPLERGPPLAPI